MSFSNLNKVWTPDTLSLYLSKIKAPEWATKICIHHTASPSLAQRPKGFTMQHIENIKSFYENDLKWNRGPHLFVDEDQLFGMTPFTEKGIHAPSFNSNAIGIEVLGDYDSEDPKSGRGLQCWENTAASVRVLIKWLNIPINDETIVFHRECAVTKRTTKKSCPGTKISKDWFLSLVNKSTNIDIKQSVVKDDKVFVPVVKYLTEEKQVPYKEAITKLKKSGNVFLYDGHLLEFAHFDTVTQSTVAPKSEIDDIFTC
jgi:N-acetylmuramoyl-L-alanine amidase CwlA